MDSKKTDIANMQAWVFRKAQNQWGMDPVRCARVFSENDLLGFISDYYDLLRKSSYQHALDKIETVLLCRGFFICRKPSIFAEETSSCRTDVEAHIVTDQQKEETAICVMRVMLLSYSAEKGIPFEQALLEFAKSRTYEGLFDFESEIWKEGPEYLRDFYEKAH